MRHPPVIWEPVYVASGFEQRTIEGLRAAIDALPKGTADLQVGRPPKVTEALFPSFLVTPANPRSAPIEGVILDGQVELRVGHSGTAELWGGRNPEQQARARQKFYAICNAVFTTHFSEEVDFDLRNRVLRSRLVLVVNGEEIKLGINLLIARLCRRTHKKEVYAYEPYY